VYEIGWWNEMDRSGSGNIRGDQSGERGCNVLGNVRAVTAYVETLQEISIEFPLVT
jgi:hypothetical protein